jgi:hypothetical protein
LTNPVATKPLGNLATPREHTQVERLKNLAAVITGGTTGIGFATAQHFVAEGVHALPDSQNAGRVQEAVTRPWAMPPAAWSPTRAPRPASPR